MVVSVLELDNIGASKLNISLAMEDRKEKFTEVVTNYQVPHNKRKSVSTGTFPAQYIRIDFLKGAPIAVKGVKVFGCNVNEAD